MDAEVLRRELDGDVRLITCLQHRAAACEEIAIVTDRQEAKMLSDATRGTGERN